MGLSFSSRTEWDTRANPLAAALERRRESGRPILDWTVSNPTLCSFDYPADAILSALASTAALRYEPDSLGMLRARAAVSLFYEEIGERVPPGRIVLTASSSEAYSYLFTLLCNPGDSVLVPKPGYPLLEDLARVNNVRVMPYRLLYDGAWHIDADSLRTALHRDTRAIVLINPNNPTGNFVAAGERDMVSAFAREHDLAVIADEVFLTFPFDPGHRPRSLLTLGAPLVFVISGLSKLAGLPQMKLGWVSLAGDDEHVAGALRRLEIIADTYLSVNTPVQVALPSILDSALKTGEEIRKRVAANYAALVDMTRGSPVSVLHSDGGWNAVLRLPATRTDDEWSLRMLERHGLLVYPGHFFEMDLKGCIVVSTLLRESTVREYATLLLGSVGAPQ